VVGSPAGSTMLIIRTDTGKGFVDAAVQNKKLVVTAGVDEKAITKLASSKIKKNSQA
jgi:coenzyme F420-reducing hydrogenase beta subunit